MPRAPQYRAGKNRRPYPDRLSMDPLPPPVGHLDAPTPIHLEDDGGSASEDNNHRPAHPGSQRAGPASREGKR